MKGILNAPSLPSFAKSQTKGVLNAPSLHSFAKSQTKGSLNAPTLPSFAKSPTKGVLNAPSLPLNSVSNLKGTNLTFVRFAFIKKCDFSFTYITKSTNETKYFFTKHKNRNIESFNVPVV